MIVSDTTATNTGRSLDAVTLLQNHFQDIGLEKPVFIACQHHILDTILKHVMNDHFGASTNSPNISYPFISIITKKYEELKTSFNNTGKSLQKAENHRWRDDMAFPEHLISCYRIFNSTGNFPKVNFRSLPAIKFRQTAEAACDFICGSWADIWFCDQCFNITDFDNLSEACKGHPKAINSLKKFWSREPTPIPTQPSNISAERAIKVMQELLPLCKSIEKMDIKFILTNVQ
ncbi:hypothetical protein CBL_05058 [Carabus blaptoides fortunei]